MAVIRVGIGGFGRSGCDIHSAWLKEAREQFAVVAVADQLPERRADAERDFGARTYTDFQEMLAAGGFDLFINALPSVLHAPASIAGLTAGYHVVSEKPSARRVADFDRILAASRASGKIFAPFQNSRFYPFFTKMREVLASGKLGKLLHARTSWGGYGRRWDWQTLQQFDGGNLLNTGPHPVDHGIMLFGEAMPHVFCRMLSVQPGGGDADDFASVTLYGEGGPVIDILISSFQAYPPSEMYALSCEYGGIAGGPNGLRWRYFDPQQAPIPAFWQPWSRNREYCHEDLPWVEESWEPNEDERQGFRYLSRAFYNNLYDVLVNGAALIVRHDEVRRQVAVHEECHRQNPLPVKVRN